MISIMSVASQPKHCGSFWLFCLFCFVLLCSVLFFPVPGQTQGLVYARQAAWHWPAPSATVLILVTTSVDPFGKKTVLKLILTQPFVKCVNLLSAVSLPNPLLGDPWDTFQGTLFCLQAAELFEKSSLCWADTVPHVTDPLGPCNTSLLPLVRDRTAVAVVVPPLPAPPNHAKEMWLCMVHLPLCVLQFVSSPCNRRSSQWSSLGTCQPHSFGYIFLWRQPKTWMSKTFDW